MSNRPQQLDDLAEERLDGAVDDVAWQAARDLHGAALDRALDRAAVCRAALAPTDAPLPPALRERLALALAARPRRSRAWWWSAALVAAAACLVLTWTLGGPGPRPPGPASQAVLAKAEAPLQDAAEADGTAGNGVYSRGAGDLDRSGAANGEKRRSNDDAAEPQVSTPAAPQVTAPTDLEALRSDVARLRQEANDLAMRADAEAAMEASAEASALDPATASARLAARAAPAPSPQREAAASLAPLAAAPQSSVPLPAATAPLLALRQALVGGDAAKDAALAGAQAKAARKPAPATWVVHIDPQGGRLVLGPDDLRIEALDSRGAVLASATTGWALTITAPVDLPVAAPPAPPGTVSQRVRISK